jgi:hypothetical protein
MNPANLSSTEKAFAQTLDGEPAVIDLYLKANGEPTIRFVLTVYTQAHQYRQIPKYHSHVRPIAGERFGQLRFYDYC